MLLHSKACKLETYPDWRVGETGTPAASRLCLCCVVYAVMSMLCCLCCVVLCCVCCVVYAASTGGATQGLQDAEHVCADAAVVQKPQSMCNSPSYCWNIVYIQGTHASLVAQHTSSRLLGESISLRSSSPSSSRSSTLESKGTVCPKPCKAQTH